MDIEHQENCAIIHCGNQMDRETVLAQKEQLQSLLQIKKPIQIVAQNLTQIDTAGIQLLLNFFQTISKSGISIQWQSTSVILQNIATLLGAKEALGLNKKESS